MKRLASLPVLLIGALIVAGYLNFIAELDLIRASTLSTLEVRTGLFRQYIRLISAKNTAMKKSFLQAYDFARNGELRPVVLESIRYFPEYQVFGLSAFDQPETANQLAATLTMAPDLDPTDRSLQSELAAVVSLDAQMATLVDDVDRTIWAYYTSARGFIYMAPKVPVSSFQFSPGLYQRVFWSQAIPENNPYGKQIISDLYDDAAGMGLMISISDPIFVDGEFLGVVSLDVGIDLMERLLNVGRAVGTSCLVDEKQQIVACSEGDGGTGMALPDTNTFGQWQMETGGWTYRVPIREGELYLAHRLDSAYLYRQAAFSSLMVWGLLVLGASLSYLVYSLRLSVAKNRELMQVDPLTKLYNRRGFHTLLQPIYAQAVRQGQPCAVLIADIDFFKKVNDSHGHATGDEVIQAVAEQLREINREGTLVCRWGGEEFLVFLQDCDRKGAATVATRIHQRIGANRFSRKQLSVTVSIGACSCDAGLPFEQLLQRADKALYQAKQGGRNRTVVCGYSDEDNNPG